MNRKNTIILQTAVRIFCHTGEKYTLLDFHLSNLEHRPFVGFFLKIQVSKKKATSSDKLKILQKAPKAQIQSRGHGSVQPSEIS